MSPTIQGLEIYRLGSIGNDDKLYQKRPGADELILPNSIVDLSGPGKEVFYSQKNGGGNDDKKITLIIIVGGTSTTITAPAKQQLHVIAQKALDDTNNTARPLSDWDLKTRSGDILDLSHTIESYGFADGTQLFLSLKAGIGG